jgi:Putative Tad-like Flp pilus-assembly
VLSVALMFVLFGVLAFTVDTGYLSQSRAEVTRCADSAALAGCWDVYRQLENDSDTTLSAMRPGVLSSANQFASLNNVCEAGPSLSDSDIQVGYTDKIRGGSISNNANHPFYAVRVKINKTGEQNGQVPFFFGKMFGSNGRDMTSESTAVMARGISGFATPAGSDTLDILPFALDENTWENMLQLSPGSSGAVDQYKLNSSTGVVSSGSDGVLEVNLYPQGTGSPGNRGTVDIGGSNNSTNDIKRQILTGISVADLQAFGQPFALDGTGELLLNGDTGISAGVKDQLAQIVGQKRIIPIFRSVTGNGNNANYTIVKFAGVRVMNVNLTGSLNSKRLIVQPAPIIAKYGIRSNSTSSSDFVLSPVMLAE